MDIGKTKKRVAAFAMAGIMAVSLSLPAMAFAADNTPDKFYNGDTGVPTGSPSTNAGENGTDLYLQYKNADNMAWNGANDGDGHWQYKVKVPVALNFVANPNGTIEGPSDAKLTNYSNFTVKVEKIQVKEADSSKATIVDSVTAPDQVKLVCKPLNGKAGAEVNLASFKRDNPVSTTWAEWRMSAAEQTVTESDGGNNVVINNELTLSELGGEAKGFQQLDPSTNVQIGTILWTITPGWSAPQGST